MYKIIFVDDEAITLQLLKCVLDWEELGIKIAGTASDGREALDLCRSVCPDIMIADIQMPGMTGVMLSEMIRKSNRDMKIIFLSAYAEFEYAQSAIANKVSGYLLKPLDEDALEMLIRKITAELDQENRDRQNSDEARDRILSAQLRESFLRWNRDQTLPLAQTDPEFLAKHSFCLLLFCDDDLDYLSGTEENVRSALKNLTGSWLLVPVNAYEYFVLSKDALVTSDLLLQLLGRSSLRCVCGCASCDGSVPESMERARLAAQSTFITGTSAAVWSETLQYTSGDAPGARDYVNAISALAESGDYRPLSDQLKALVLSFAQAGRDPDSLFSAIQDILIWLKNDIVRIHPDTELAAGALRHVDRLRLRSCLTPQHLIRFLTRLLTELSEQICTQMDSGSSSAVIRRARYYAAQHASEPDFSLQAAADYAGLSRNHFSKVFHEGTGIKFWDYVTELRIRNARKLLAETDLPIAAVAQQVGYETEAHLNRRFKQAEGITPGQYRRKYR